jgi:hypothetical protein
MELPRSIFANALNISPFVGAGVEHRSDAPESCKERAGCRGRDAWDGCEHRLAGVLVLARPLRVGRPIDRPSRLLGTHCEPIQPRGCLVSIDCPDESYALLHHSKTGPTDGTPAQWASFEIGSLEKEVGPSAGAAKATHLRPEPSLDKRLVQVKNLFAFDEHAVADNVVAGSKRDHLNVGAQRRESLGDSTGAFIDVDLDDGHKASSLASEPTPTLDAVWVRSLVFSRSENT